jgi:dynein heavy chain 1
VVLSAAYVTLASGFTQKYRLMLLKKWQKALFNEEISCNEDFVLQELFGDTFTIRDWHSNLLPKDQVAIDNAIIMDKTKQYVIMVDPQQQAVEWIKSQYKSKGLVVTNIRDVNFRKSLETAIEMGQPIIV